MNIGASITRILINRSVTYLWVLVHTSMVTYIWWLYHTIRTNEFYSFSTPIDSIFKSTKIVKGVAHSSLMQYYAVVQTSIVFPISSQWTTLTHIKHISIKKTKHNCKFLTAVLYVILGYIGLHLIGIWVYLCPDLILSQTIYLWMTTNPYSVIH